MKTRTRIAAIGLGVATLTAGGATAAFAGSSDLPVPTDSSTAAVYPTQRPTPPPVVNPQRNQFRNCRFTLTQELTFAPQLGRFVRENVPSITCWSRQRGVQVYTLSGPGAF